MRFLKTAVRMIATCIRLRIWRRGFTERCQCENERIMADIDRIQGNILRMQWQREDIEADIYRMTKRTHDGDCTNP